MGAKIDKKIELRKIFIKTMGLGYEVFRNSAKKPR
jgi:hypothetical protein